MRARYAYGATAWAACLLALLAVHCEVDHGIGPLEGGISGTITFVGSWPESVEEVVIVASQVYPPASLADLIVSEPLPLGVAAHPFHLPLPPGTYRLIGVAWRAAGEPWDLNSLVATYSPDGLGLPGQVVLESEASRVSGIDITVDFRTGAITGTVTLAGAWPESTQEVRVAVYATYPPTNFFAIKGYSEPFPLGASTYEYSVSLAPGTYQWVIVVWRAQGKFWGPEGYLGMYTATPDSTRPGEVAVVQGRALGGIDMAVDFARMGELPPEVEEMLGQAH